MEMKWSDDGWLKWSRNGLRKPEGSGFECCQHPSGTGFSLFLKLGQSRVALFSNLPLIEQGDEGPFNFLRSYSWSQSGEMHSAADRLHHTQHNTLQEKSSIYCASTKDVHSILYHMTNNIPLHRDLIFFILERMAPNQQPVRLSGEPSRGCYSPFFSPQQPQPEFMHPVKKPSFCSTQKLPQQIPTMKF